MRSAAEMTFKARIARCVVLDFDAGCVALLRSTAEIFSRARMFRKVRGALL